MVTLLFSLPNRRWNHPNDLNFWNNLCYTLTCRKVRFWKMISFWLNPKRVWFCMEGIWPNLFNFSLDLFNRTPWCFIIYALVHIVCMMFGGAFREFYLLYTGQGCHLYCLGFFLLLFKKKSCHCVGQFYFSHAITQN